MIYKIIIGPEMEHNRLSSGLQYPFRAIYVYYMAIIKTVLLLKLILISDFVSDNSSSSFYCFIIVVHLFYNLILLSLRLLTYNF